jgi:hypothetical protein
MSSIRVRGRSRTRARDRKRAVHPSASFRLLKHPWCGLKRGCTSPFLPLVMSWPLQRTSTLKVRSVVRRLAVDLPSSCRVPMADPWACFSSLRIETTDGYHIIDAGPTDECLAVALLVQDQTMNRLNMTRLELNSRAVKARSRVKDRPVVARSKTRTRFLGRLRGAKPFQHLRRATNRFWQWAEIDHQPMRPARVVRR